MSIIDSLDKAAADLAQQGITLVRSANSKSSDGAWCDAVERHGERIALIHLVDGVWSPWPRQRGVFYDREWFNMTRLKVRYSWKDVATGAAVRAALAAQGFRVEWDGSSRDTVHIVLD
jgi:hypothetical protein